MGVVDGNIQEEIRCYVMRSTNVGQRTFSHVRSVLVAPSTKGTLTVTLLPSTGTTCLSATSGDWVIVLLWLRVHICTPVLLRLHKIYSEFLLLFTNFDFPHMFLCLESHYYRKFKLLQHYFWSLY